MSIEVDIYNYLEANLPSYYVFYGKSNLEDGDKTIVFFRLPGTISQDNPIKEVVYQFSCRARDIDECRNMSNQLVYILRGLYGKLTSTNIRVLNIRDLGDLYEEDARLCHIPLEVTAQIVE
jgi:hypothetical protein